MLGMGIYLDLSAPTTENQALAFALVLHGLQVVWYVGFGALALGSKHVSFADLLAARNSPREDE